MTAFDWLAQGFIALTLIDSAILCLVILGLLYLLWLHLALRREGLATESRRLARPLAPDADLPHVVVQIPSFNEGAIIQRCIAKVAELDWPKDKLHIQVCDDSTDETTELARAAARQAALAGVDVAVLHRDNRKDFKAGALNEARAKAGYDYVAILDVDYMPSRDFLRRCVSVLLGDPNLGFVQARIDFLNAGENMLTRAQAVLLDAHFAFEQATRSWGNHVLPFNGTCGVWRGAAIDDAGGWRGDKLTEDWDLSYRAWAKGWRGTFLSSVNVLGELPTTFATWGLQQQRWAAGIGQVAYAVVPKILFARDLSLQQRIAGLLPFGTWFAFLISAITVATTLATLALKPNLWPLGLSVYGIFLVLVGVLFVIMRVTNQFVRPGTPLLRFVADFFFVPWLALYMAWAHLRTLPATLLGRPRVFVRTPKQGSPAIL